MAKKATTNIDRLQSLKERKMPVLTLDVEITGQAKGNDNRVTQIAMAAYVYNKDTDAYELQDNLFMLAKANLDVIKKIEENTLPSKENVVKSLQEEYITIKYIQPIMEEIKIAEANGEKYKARIALLEDQIEKKKADPMSVRRGLSVLEADLATMNKKMSQIVNPELYKKIEDIKNRKDELAIEEDCQKYIIANYDAKMETFNNAYTLPDTLKRQGIDKDLWMKTQNGLDDGELKIGIEGFFNKYLTDDTMFVMNGGNMYAHYLAKNGIVLPEREHLDLKFIKLQGVAPNFWAYGRKYYASTKREITTYDALTKALMCGEMLSDASGITVNMDTLEMTKNAVVKDAFKPDNECVVTISDLAAHNISSITEKELHKANTRFDQLQYIDFGNERRYVDIDKMFTLNGDYSITLDGEKTPIQSWEDLENRIKSLNANISKALLEQIHQKFMECKAEQSVRIEKATHETPPAATAPQPAPAREETAPEQVKSFIVEGYSDNMLAKATEIMSRLDVLAQTGKLLNEEICEHADKLKDMVKADFVKMIPFIGAVYEKVDNPSRISYNDGYYKVELNNGATVLFDEKDKDVDFLGTDVQVSEILTNLDDFKKEIENTCMNELEQGLIKKTEEIENKKKLVKKIQKQYGDD